MKRVPLKYPGLAPWEIWLSEAQERMVLAVPPDKLAALRQLCDAFECELTDIGAFTGDGHLRRELSRQRRVRPEHGDFCTTACRDAS